MLLAPASHLTENEMPITYLEKIGRAGWLETLEEINGVPFPEMRTATIASTGTTVKRSVYEPVTKGVTLGVMLHSQGKLDTMEIEDHWFGQVTPPASENDPLPDFRQVSRACYNFSLGVHGHTNGVPMFKVCDQVCKDDRIKPIICFQQPRNVHKFSTVCSIYLHESPPT